MNFIRRAVVKGNLSYSAAQIYEENVVLFRLSRRSQEEKFPYRENLFLLSCERNTFLCCFVFVLLYRIACFRHSDSVAEIGLYLKCFLCVK
jgi:hypothetical protein